MCSAVDLNQFLKLIELSISFYICAPISELPSNMSTRLIIVQATTWNKKKVQFMVLILDGNSEIGAQVRSNPSVSGI